MRHQHRRQFVRYLSVLTSRGCPDMGWQVHESQHPHTCAVCAAPCHLRARHSEGRGYYLSGEDLGLEAACQHEPVPSQDRCQESRPRQPSVPTLRLASFRCSFFSTSNIRRAALEQACVVTRRLEYETQSALSNLLDTRHELTLDKTSRFEPVRDPWHSR
jgi:hypothetical protein